MHRQQKRRFGLALAGLGGVATIAAVFIVWPRGESAQQQLQRSLAHAPSVVITPDQELQIRAFCGDCHQVPQAESFPRDAWHDKVQRGYQFYAQSGRNDLTPPPINVAVEYFRRAAPDEVQFPEPAEAETPLRASFRVEKLQFHEKADVPPRVSHLRWTSLRPDAPPVLLCSDMRRGDVTALDLRSPDHRCHTLARLNNPCRIEPCDLNGDGTTDLVVADLGSSMAVDHDRGRVVWLKPEGGAGTYGQVILASGLGRVADVRSADMEGDGDLDLLVAEFGHYRTGGIHLLRNMAEPGEDPRFLSEQLDSRPGTIHVPVVDIDRDGRLDFVALISQEYERVEVFLNQGEMDFRRQILWTAPDLTFGSSGIELVDLDNDGDQDILYSNGDAFDNMYVTPWHGLQWLENCGEA